MEFTKPAALVAEESTPEDPETTFFSTSVSTFSWMPPVVLRDQDCLTNGTIAHEASYGLTRAFEADRPDGKQANLLLTLSHGKDPLWVVDDVLSSEECDFLSGMIESQLQTSPAQCTPSVNKGEVVGANFQCVADRLSEIIGHRCRNIIPQKVFQRETLLDSEDDVEKLSQQWAFRGFSPLWRMFRRNPGYGLRQHQDRIFVPSTELKSIYSSVTYLVDPSEDISNGAFFCRAQYESGSDSEAFTADVDGRELLGIPIKKGRTIIFHHRIVHGAFETRRGSEPRYYMRSKLIYERMKHVGGEVDADAVQLLKGAVAARLAGDDTRYHRLQEEASTKSPLLDNCMYS